MYAAMMLCWGCSRPGAEKEGRGRGGTAGGGGGRGWAGLGVYGGCRFGWRLPDRHVAARDRGRGGSVGWRMGDLANGDIFVSLGWVVGCFVLFQGRSTMDSRGVG